MEENRGDKEACQGYHLSAPAQSRPPPVKDGETEAEGGGRAAETGTEPCTQGVTEAEYPVQQDWLRGEGQDAC